MIIPIVLCKYSCSYRYDLEFMNKFIVNLYKSAIDNGDKIFFNLTEYYNSVAFLRPFGNRIRFDLSDYNKFLLKIISYDGEKREYGIWKFKNGEYLFEKEDDYRIRLYYINIEGIE